MRYHLHMWQPREFLFRKVFMQYLHTTISALALLLQKKSRVWEHRSTFSVQSLLHQTCACPWCVWRGHAKTAAGNSTGRFSSRPPPPMVVRCHRHFLRNKLLIQQTLLIYTVQYILYNTSRVRGKCKYQIWDGFHFYLRGRNQRWIGLETGSRVSSHHYCSLAMLEGVDCTYIFGTYMHIAMFTLDNSMLTGCSPDVNFRILMFSNRKCLRLMFHQLFGLNLHPCICFHLWAFAMIIETLHEEETTWKVCSKIIRGEYIHYPKTIEYLISKVLVKQLTSPVRPRMRRVSATARKPGKHSCSMLTSPL